MTHVRLTGCLALLTLSTTLTACSSDVITIAPRPPAHYEKLGHTEGQGCAVLLFYSTVYSIIPIMMGSRVERAYADALAKKPGATALMNTEMSQWWVWWVIGTSYCTMIEGDAIRESAAPAEAPPAAEPAPAPAPPAPGTSP